MAPWRARTLQALPRLTGAPLYRALGTHTRPGEAIGLLGGSFNPPHQGHVEISLSAQKRLGLDRVWWLVSPQNPLKPADQTKDLALRVAQCEALTKAQGIHVSTLEQTLGSRFTAETLLWLTWTLPRVNFVWLMGADNLVQIARWKAWQQIFHLVPIAALGRPHYSLKALVAPAARRFASARIDPDRARGFATWLPPVWTFVPGRMTSISSSALRAATLKERR